MVDGIILFYICSEACAWISFPYNNAFIRVYPNTSFTISFNLWSLLRPLSIILCNLFGTLKLFLRITSYTFWAALKTAPHDFSSFVHYFYAIYFKWPLSRMFAVFRNICYKYRFVQQVREATSAKKDLHVDTTNLIYSILKLARVDELKCKLKHFLTMRFMLVNVGN